MFDLFVVRLRSRTNTMKIRVQKRLDCLSKFINYSIQILKFIERTFVFS